jgi:hypothetical protein
MSVQVPSNAMTVGTGLLALGSTAAAVAAGLTGLWSLSLLLSASCAGLMVLLGFFWRLRKDAGQDQAAPAVGSAQAVIERTLPPAIEPPCHGVATAIRTAPRRARAEADAVPA